MNDIVMPKLSDTMVEGRLISWKKRVGEIIRRGDVLAEVETDKANMELESFTSGVLLEIRVQAGEMAAVGTVIAVVGKPEEKGAQQGQGAPPVEPPAHPAGEAPKEEAAKGEEKGAPAEGEGGPPPAGEGGGGAMPPPAAAQKPQQGQPQPGESPAAIANATTGAEGEKQAPAAPRAAAGEMQAPAQPAEQPAETIPSPPPQPEKRGEPAQFAAPGREKAAPVVRRRARELGVDLSQVKGSGPDGRILLQDLEGREGGAQPPQPEGARPAAPPEGAKAAPPEGARPAPAEEGRPAAAAKEPLEEGTKPLPRLRAAVAKTVTESWESIPHFTVTMEIAMDDAEAIRRQLKQSGVPVTVNDMVVKGVALALEKFPNLRASLAGGGMQVRGEINIGVAVGVNDGVLIPVIQGCQQLSLQEISQQAKKLAERARSGALTEQEMSGGIFSVSNLGMYGVSHFTAIIYPTHAGVLTVGAVVESAVVRGGTVVAARMMKVTLCADHRLVDGAYAAEFLVELKGILENPVRLLI